MPNNIELAFLLANYIDNARWELTDGGSSLVNYTIKPEDIKDKEKRAEYIILSPQISPDTKQICLGVLLSGISVKHFALYNNAH